MSHRAPIEEKLEKLASFSASVVSGIHGAPWLEAVARLPEEADNELTASETRRASWLQLRTYVRSEIVTDPENLRFRQALYGHGVDGAKALWLRRVRIRPEMRLAIEPNVFHLCCTEPPTAKRNPL